MCKSAKHPTRAVPPRCTSVLLVVQSFNCYLLFSYCVEVLHWLEQYSSYMRDEATVSRQHLADQLLQTSSTLVQQVDG